MNDDLTRRIRVLEDREEIARLNHRYARLIDNGRLEEFAALFTHGNWRGTCAGAAEVLAWIKENVKLYAGTPRTNHLVSALDIVVGIEGDDDRATGESVVTIYQQHPDGKEISVITINDFTDEYRRIDGAWWFHSRRTKRRLEGDMSLHVVNQQRK